MTKYRTTYRSVHSLGRVKRIAHLVLDRAPVVGDTSKPVRMGMVAGDRHDPIGQFAPHQTRRFARLANNEDRRIKAPDALPENWTAPPRQHGNHTHPSGALVWSNPETPVAPKFPWYYWAPGSASSLGIGAATRAQAMSAALGFEVYPHGSAWHWMRIPGEFCCREKTVSFDTAELAALDALRFDAEQRRKPADTKPARDPSTLPPGWRRPDSMISDRLEFVHGKCAVWKCNGDPVWRWVDGVKHNSGQLSRAVATMHEAMALARGCTIDELWSAP